MKYTIIMSCGHEDTVDLIGKTSERERKIEYFKNYGLCKECYKKKMREKEESTPLSFNVSPFPAVSEDDGSILAYVWFEGNTRPYKDEIKKLGYTWERRKSADDYSSSDVPMCWGAIIKVDDLKNEIEKAKTIGVEIKNQESFASAAFWRVGVEAQKRWKEKQGKLKSIEKPVVPDIIKGHKWNKKIYGKKGNYSIYPDGEKVVISDEEADILKSYLKEKEEYNRKVEEIEHA